MEIPESEIERVKENLRRQKEYFAKLRELPEFQEQAKRFKNWSAHVGVIGYVQVMRCPKCGQHDTLVWSCCDLSVEEALELARKKTEDGGIETKRARIEAGIKLNSIPLPLRGSDPK